MKAFILNVAIWLLVLSALQNFHHVSGQATQKDVNTLKKKIAQLKNLIKSIQRETNRTTLSFEKFQGNAVKVEVRQVKEMKSLQAHCDGRVRLCEKYTRNQVNLLSKMLKSRVNNTGNKLSADYKRTQAFLSEFRTKIDGVRKDADTANEENKKIAGEREGHMITISNGLRERNVESIENDLFVANRQMQLQQFSQFERTRSNGFSGIKQIRSSDAGGRNYFSADHKDWSVAGITDHPELKDVLGIGEFAASLNGIDFTSSEQHYKLQQPSYNGVYDDTKPVQFPDVPSAVKSLASVTEQITEMRNWFIDFQNGDSSTRQIEGHFKPFLSYVEGAFVSGSRPEGELDWNLYLKDTGTPYDIAYGPSTVLGFSEKKKPQYSAWNNRIVVHPITKVPLSPKMFKLNPDIVSQVRHYNSEQNLRDSPAADFGIEHLNKVGKEYARPNFFTYLDTIMSEVVGKENSDKKLDSFGLDGEEIISANTDVPESEFNAGTYHRAYKLKKTDAMGISNAQRSFSDRLFIAITNQTQVSGPELVTEDSTRHVRSTYAFPVEILFLTPLSTWNPYQVSFKEDCELVTGDGSKESPFDAACPERYNLTPQAFFDESEECDNIPGLPASFFISSGGPAVCLVESGIRTVLPKIQGHHQRIRQRYPIVPVFKDGNSAAKKLNAIEDGLSLVPHNVIAKVSLLTGASCVDPTNKHKHRIRLSMDQYHELQKNGVLKSIKTLEDSNNHQHIFTITMQRDGAIQVTECDSPSEKAERMCWDQHIPLLEMISEPLKSRLTGYGY